jgi:hypothetical protein
LFTYHVIFDRKDKDSKPRYVPVHISYLGPAEVDRTMMSVLRGRQCIEGLIEYGIEKPWPDSRKWDFNDAYRAISGRMLPKGAVPDGFTSKYKEQIEAEAESE